MQPKEPFEMREVAEVFAKFSRRKQQIVDHLKFSGLMNLTTFKAGSTSLFNWNFSLWLMNNVDVKERALSFNWSWRIRATPRDSPNWTS
jgi:hypothetical protein